MFEALPFIMAVLSACSVNNTVSNDEKPVEILSKESFELVYKNPEEISFLNSRDDFESFYGYVISESNDFLLFYEHTKESFDFNLYSYLVCPFKFSSSETNIQLMNLSFDADHFYVDFSLKSPDTCDSDLRVCYFLNQLNKNIVDDLLTKDCVYRIHNSLGKGSYYYE